MKIVILIFIFLILVFLYLISNKNSKMKAVTIEQVYDYQKKLKNIYEDIKLKKIFKKYPKKVRGLVFGYICPGAMKTIEYLNKNVISFVMVFEISHDLFFNIFLI